MTGRGRQWPERLPENGSRGLPENGSVRRVRAAQPGENIHPYLQGLVMLGAGAETPVKNSGNLKKGYRGPYYTLNILMLKIFIIYIFRYSGKNKAPYSLFSSCQSFSTGAIAPDPNLYSGLRPPIFWNKNWPVLGLAGRAIFGSVQGDSDLFKRIGNPDVQRVYTDWKKARREQRRRDWALENLGRRDTQSDAGARFPFSDRSRQ